MNNILTKAGVVVTNTCFRSAAAGVAATLIALPAFAQEFERDRNQSVMERPRPEYDPLGKRLGGFTAFPSLTTSAIYDDNVFAAPTDEVNDVILRGLADLRVTSNWSVHALEFRGTLGSDKFLDLDTEDRTDITLSAAGRVDVLRSTQIGGEVSHQDLMEDRTASNAPRNAVKPVRYDVDSIEAYAQRESGRLRLRGEVDFQELDYDNVYNAAGAILDQNFRDRDLFTATVRSELAISPATAIFLEGAYNEFSYKQDLVGFGSRDSEGYAALGGVSFDITQLMRGEVAVGYRTQSYDNPLLSDSNSLAARGNVQWFPTPLLTVVLDASRTEESSDLATSPGYLASAVGISADYELLRNLIISAGLSYHEDDYKGVDRTDSHWNRSLSATYMLNRNWAVSANYAYLEQDSSGLQAGVSDYDQNRLGLAVRFQY